MINFFRKIRQRLLTENKFSNYLLYAIGEIILVVIGILLALQVNNWNVNRKNTAIVRVYLENLVRELEGQVGLYEKFYLDRFERKMDGLYLAKSYYEGNYAIEDTLDFLNAVSYGAVSTTGIERSYYNIFESLKSTGDIGLIESELQNSILRHYESLYFENEVSMKQLSNYQKLMNSSRPFDPVNPTFISPFDQREMVKRLRTTEAYHTTNNEISSANHTLGRVKRIVGSAKILLVKLKAKLAGD